MTPTARTVAATFLTLAAARLRAAADRLILGDEGGALRLISEAQEAQRLATPHPAGDLPGQGLP